ncbi:MAG: response regulator [Bacteroides sp.]|nr:response regulator [Prevotella sp.]MCM1408163.1 response regulator [Treponema brennaborense]MCM1469487.1 response regulator [Bacteroides sp.]
MYHCHIRFYLVGEENTVFDAAAASVPLENFEHELIRSPCIEKHAAETADAIFACLAETEMREIFSLSSLRRKNVPLIVLCRKECADFVFAEQSLAAKIDDIWFLPMTKAEAEFRFAKWQHAFKQQKDFWQTSQFLESTINFIPNLVWYKDKNGIHEKVNDSFCAAVNKTKSQVQGRGHAYIWDVEKDDPACIESERKVMDGRRTIISDETIMTGEGTRLLTTYKSPLYDVDGSVMGTVGVAIDVTQERAYKQEITERSRMLEAVLEAMDCGVICHTIDGTEVVSINAAALKILGYKSIEELVDDGFSTVAMSVLDEDKDRLRKILSALKKEGDRVSMEYRVRHDNGEIISVMGSAKLIRENGRLLCQRFLLDCTAQKMQEQREKKHHQELVYALSADYSLICYFDLDTGSGVPLRMDEETQQMLGDVFSDSLSLENTVSRYIETCVYGDDRSFMREALKRENLIREMAENKMRYMNYRVSFGGKMLYFQMKIVRVGEWSTCRAIVLGFRSVDEMTRMEIMRRSQLEDALVQANAANKAKTAFLSNMSHDIRTPMNAVIGFTSLALKHIDNHAQVEQFLHKIMSSGSHLLRLINDVLDMSHIESGKIHIEEKPADLSEILHGLRDIVQADAKAKQLEISMDTVGVVDEEIFCDKLRLNQVLLNILSNSVKYTPAGGKISMRITEKRLASNGCADYEFVISDTGIGMSAEFLAHIFEPFEREQNSTVSGIQGTGLGMAITKNIVDMMHGTISVKSEQGKGTEFSVLFTFRLNSDEKALPVIEKLRNCRALVADDDSAACTGVSSMLSQIGLRAEWTQSGEDALRLLHQAKADEEGFFVCIIDWQLSDMDALEAARRIRAEIGDDMHIIVLSAYDWGDIEEEAKKAGITTFCAKPLFFSELRACLNSIVNEQEKNKNAAASSEAEKVRGERILLVEDNEINQEIAQLILLDAGFSCEIAANGKEAIDLLSEHEPDYYRCILMDIQMPVMNGYEAAQTIRAMQDPRLSQIPIIAMTANAFEEDRQTALRSGMNGHIAKPIDTDELFSELDKILGT